MSRVLPPPVRSGASSPWLPAEPAWGAEQPLAPWEEDTQEQWSPRSLADRSVVLRDRREYQEEASTRRLNEWGPQLYQEVEVLAQDKAAACEELERAVRERDLLLEERDAACAELEELRRDWDRLQQEQAGLREQVQEQQRLLHLEPAVRESWARERSALLRERAQLSASLQAAWAEAEAMRSGSAAQLSASLQAARVEAEAMRSESEEARAHREKAREEREAAKVELARLHERLQMLQAEKEEEARNLRKQLSAYATEIDNLRANQREKELELMEHAVRLEEAEGRLTPRSAERLIGDARERSEIFAESEMVMKELSEQMVMQTMDFRRLMEQLKGELHGTDGRPGLQHRLSACERDLEDVLQAADFARMSTDEWRAGHERLEQHSLDLRRQHDHTMQQCFEHQEALRAWRELDQRRRERRRSQMKKDNNIAKYMAKVMDEEVHVEKVGFKTKEKQPRILQLLNDSAGPRLLWSKWPGSRVSVCKLDDVTAIFYGMTSMSHARVDPGSVDPTKCFSLITPKRSFDFIGKKDEEVECLVLSISRLCQRSKSNGFPVEGALDSHAEFIAARGWCKVENQCQKRNTSLASAMKLAIKRASPRALRPRDPKGAEGASSRSPRR